MNSRALLAVAAGFFMLGMFALAGAIVFASRRAPEPAPPAPVAVAPPVTPAPGPAAPTPAPAAPPAPTPPPAAQPPTVVVPASPPAPAPEPAPAPQAPPGAPPAPPPAPAGKPMRPELGLALSESQAITSPLEIGPSSIGFAERSPKVAGLIGGSPASQGGIKLGDHVFAVDGRSIKSVADFEAEMSKKTIPGEVVLRVGPTSSEAQSVRIVFK